MKNKLTRQQFATLLNLSTRRIDQLAEAGVISKDRDGRFDGWVSLYQLLEHYKKRAINAERLLRRFHIIPDEEGRI